MCFKKFSHPLEQGPTNTFRFEELFRLYIEAPFHIANDIQRYTRAFLSNNSPIMVPRRTARRV